MVLLAEMLGRTARGYVEGKLPAEPKKRAGRLEDTKRIVADIIANPNELFQQVFLLFYVNS